MLRDFWPWWLLLDHLTESLDVLSTKVDHIPRLRAILVSCLSFAEISLQLSLFAPETWLSCQPSPTAGWWDTDQTSRKSVWLHHTPQVLLRDFTCVIIRMKACLQFNVRYSPSFIRAYVFQIEDFSLKLLSPRIHLHVGTHECWNIARGILSSVSSNYITWG